MKGKTVVLIVIFVAAAAVLRDSLGKAAYDSMDLVVSAWKAPMVDYMLLLKAGLLCIMYTALMYLGMYLRVHVRKSNTMP